MTIKTLGQNLLIVLTVNPKKKGVPFSCTNLGVNIITVLRYYQTRLESSEPLNIIKIMFIII